MTRYQSALVSLAGLALAAPVCAQSGNNSCTNATPIPGPGTYSGTTVGASNDGTANCGASEGSPDVWYTYTPAENKLLVVETCGLANWDTVLSIHTGCRGAPGATVLACNDDACGLQTIVQTSVTAGISYLIRVSGYSGATGAYSIRVTLQDPPPPPTTGPDVIIGNLIDVGRYAAIGGITSFAVGTDSCNVGDAPIEWIANTPEHPVIAQNMFRIKEGRLEQIGQSWVKHGFSSVNGSLCFTCTPPPGGSSQLGVGCSDPYGSGLNGSQGGLGPRSEVNATTGVFRYPFGGRAPANDLDRRLQVATADIDPALNAGAVYFVEGQYVTQDDAGWNNGLNNASYRRIRFASATATPTFLAATVRTKSALWAWREVDPTVSIVNADYVENGITCRFEVASKVTDNGNGTWTYVYAVRNMNSHRSAAGLVLPARNGVTFTNVGFRDVAHHSGEPFNGNDWLWSDSGQTAGWRTDQTYAQNQNANALRWGNAYTFWFTANTPPADAAASMPFFRPGVTDAVAVTLPVPAAVPCAPDFNDDGFLDFFDYDAFVTCFEGGTCPPNRTADINADGFVDFFDYDDFVAAFEAGC
jgi:hypothetical protein